MGLAGPRNRTKISNDPRNTAWSNSTTGFGHRMLTTLGWTPGSTLGDTTSLYHQSGHITQASQAGVKIVLKDDNLGIGCNKRSRDDECVGLEGLQDLLGRLNGKSGEQIDKEAESREKLRRDVIVGERYGMRFVRGETYVSSDIETLVKMVEEEKKKIKHEESDEEAVELESLPIGVKKDKKERKSKKSASKSTPTTLAPNSETASKSSSKKRKRLDDGDFSKSIKEEEASMDKQAPKMSKKSKNGETRQERKIRRGRQKREKEARKAEKRKKKRKSSSDSSDSSDGEESTAPSGTATPSYPTLVGRQAVRHRYIAAKRSAVMDAKALNEIFMIKA